MASNQKRRMQQAVGVVRTLEAGLSQRRPSELLMLSSVTAVVHASEDLSTDLVICHREDADRIIEAIRDAIGEQGRKAPKSDSTGLDQISDPVSRLICQRQIPVVEKVHLMAAILLGVEAGLRDVVTAHSFRGSADGRTVHAKQVTRDTAPLSKSKVPKESRTKTEAPSDFSPVDPPESLKLLVESPNGSAGPSSRVTPDTPNL